MNSIDRLANTTLSLVVEKTVLGNIIVYFKDVYESDGCVLTGIFGIGGSAEEAAADYYKQIKGKKLIANPSSKTRKEVMIL